MNSPTQHLSRADTDTTASDREVLTELNALHARALQRMPIILAVVMTSIGLFMFTPGMAWPFTLWAVLVVAVEVVRAIYATAVLRRAEAWNPRSVHRSMTALAGLAGATVGVGAAYFIPSLSLLAQAQLCIFLFVMPAAGVTVSQSSRYTVAAYSVTLLLPATIVWMHIHPSLFWTVAAGSPIFCLLLILLAADGDKLLRRSVLIRHERDRLIQDLERKNAEVQVAVAKAEAAALARARVLAAASHDLRQPLHALSVYSAVLTAQPEPAVLAEVGGHIVEMVRSLGSVLNGLLDLSRLSSGYYVPERQPVALDQILAPVCAEFIAAARVKGLELQLDLQPAAVQSDPVAMARITRNLIDNAIKYTERGIVQVTTRTEPGPDGPLALLTVTDTGKGIDAEDQQRIFEEFYQIGNPGRDRSQGVGLGLAIVQRLTELLDATISVSSTPGVGSTFSMSLAALVGADAPTPAVRSTQAPVDLRGRRVYVVDDELEVLRGTRTLLELWNLEVHGANSAAAAEQLCAERGPPDLMIADLRLGEGEHGTQLAARLQQSFGQFPVLIISGETSSAALRETNLSSFPLLHKPVTPEVFRAAVARALT
jgi:two-component system, sensor histidine kinase